MTFDRKEALSSFLAEQILRIGESPLSDEDRSVARQHLLDAIASAFIGCRGGAFQSLTALCPQGKGRYGWPGSGSQHLEVLDGVMLWAFAINGSVFEDGSREGACHPAAAIMPVVLTIGRDSPWEKIDQAIVAGYDVMIRVARAGNPSFSAKGFHPTSITAPFGAAAAASVIMALDFAKTQNALCLSALGSSGLMAAFRCGSTQPLQVAWAVRSGMAAALMASAGHAGYSRIIEEGFYPTYLGDDPAPPLDDPFPSDSAIKGSYLKPYPGCRHLHPIIDAFAKIWEKHTLAPGDIEKVSVGTYKTAVDSEIHDIRARGDAYFIIPYAIATRAVLGKNDYHAFGEEHFTNSRLNQLMKKVEVSVDPEVNGWYPQKRGAIVEVAMADGNNYKEKVSHALGEPENPLAVSVTLEKLRDTASGFLSDKTIGRIEGILESANPSEPASGLFEALSENVKGI